MFNGRVYIKIWLSFWAKAKLSLAFLAGDDFYPEQPDYYKTSHNMDEHIDKTCEQFRQVAINIHRTEHTAVGHARIHQTISPFDDHLSSHSHDDCSSNSKLWPKL